MSCWTSVLRQPGRMRRADFFDESHTAYAWRDEHCFKNGGYTTDGVANAGELCSFSVICHYQRSKEVNDPKHRWNPPGNPGPWNSAISQKLFAIQVLQPVKLWDFSEILCNWIREVSTFCEIPTKFHQHRFENDAVDQSLAEFEKLTAKRCLKATVWWFF